MFWESYNASKHAYHEFNDSLRGKRLAFSEVDSAIDKLSGWKGEFESLRSEAYMEQNQTVALGKIEDAIRGVERKIDQLLDIRNKLSSIQEATIAKASYLQESINRLENSIQYDNEKLSSSVRKNGNYWEAIAQRIDEKRVKLKSMKDALDGLQDKLSRL